MTCLCEKVHFFIGILTECRGTAERHQEATFLKVSGSAARPEIITKAEKDPGAPSNWMIPRQVASEMGS
jgi:hypothetical protein